MASQVLTLVGGLAGEAGSQPGGCQGSVLGLMMGDTPSGVVARRMWPSRVDRLRVVDPRPGKPHLCRAMTVIITSVKGGAWEPQSGFPDGECREGLRRSLWTSL